MRKNRIPANAAVLAAAFTLAAGLSACGGSGTAAEKAETVQETEAAASEEKAADEEGQESAGEEAEKKDGAEKSGIAQPKEQKKQAPEHLELTASREYEEILNDTGGNVGGINWTTLTVADADHPELKNALEEYGKKTKERMDKAKKELREYYDEFLAGQEGYYDNCTAHMSVVPVRADDRVLSLMEFYSFYPDSHTEVHEKKGFCFDPATGKEMAVSEVLEDAEGAGAVIAEAIRKAYPDLKFDSDMEEKVKSFAVSSEPAEGFGFNLGYHELRIFADDGYLTSRMGGVDVPLSVAEYPDLVKEEYREIPEDYMYWVGCGEKYILDDAGRTFSMEVLEDNPDEMYCRVQINAGDAAICSTSAPKPMAETLLILWRRPSRLPTWPSGALASNTTSIVDPVVTLVAPAVTVIAERRLTIITAIRTPDAALFRKCTKQYLRFCITLPASLSPRDSQPKVAVL